MSVKRHRPIFPGPSGFGSRSGVGGNHPRPWSAATKPSKAGQSIAPGPAQARTNATRLASHSVSPVEFAGLGWTVRTEQAYHTHDVPLLDGTGSLRTTDAIPAQVVIRNDNHKVLGVVGTRWTPVQNVDALKWFDRWIDTGKVRIETAGSLFGGRHVWALARIVSDPITIKGDDTVNKYVLIAHSHDGTMAIRCGLTAVRVVCNNTLGLALRNGERSLIRVSHTARAIARLEDAANEIERIDARLNQSGDAYRTLARADVTEADKAITAFVGAVYGQKREDVEAGRRRDRIAELFESGTGQDLAGSRGTYWGLYNALTEYETHNPAAKKPTQHSRETRAQRNVFGSGASTLARGLDVAIVMARGTFTIDEVFGRWSDATAIADAAHPEALSA